MGRTSSVVVAMVLVAGACSSDVAPTPSPSAATGMELAAAAFVADLCDAVTTFREASQLPEGSLDGLTWKEGFVRSTTALRDAYAGFAQDLRATVPAGIDDAEVLTGRWIEMSEDAIAEIDAVLSSTETLPRSRDALFGVLLSLGRPAIAVPTALGVTLDGIPPGLVISLVNPVDASDVDAITRFLLDADGVRAATYRSAEENCLDLQRSGLLPSAITEGTDCTDLAIPAVIRVELTPDADGDAIALAAGSMAGVDNVVVQATGEAAAIGEATISERQRTELEATAATLQDGACDGMAVT